MAEVTKSRLNPPPTAKRVSRAESGLVQSSDRRGRIPSATPIFLSTSPPGFKTARSRHCQASARTVLNPPVLGYTRKRCPNTSHWPANFSIEPLRTPTAPENPIQASP
ncbi:hypothetical protein GGP41_008977 [Bipolaris sorokiniana]|uniref:Uncharacterized protein n=1 Tax=Cochliobolus sativus TaxID=45130 RepID=A0A8H5ZED9_COCSA|nr:hypothetical protein GGP41_008977 [Bipolaris sorokiniana]